MKTVTLLCLLSGQRLQSMHLIDVRNIDLTDDHVKIRYGDLLKQSRLNYQQSELHFKAYDNKKLCVVSLLCLYLRVTKSLRGEEKSLFISYCKPHKKVSKDTIARWVKDVLKASGIDVAIFKPHSCRAASVSQANKMRLPLTTILRTAGWSSECTFRKFYNRPVTNDASFAEAVLSSHTGS